MYEKVLSQFLIVDYMIPVQTFEMYKRNPGVYFTLYKNNLDSFSELISYINLALKLA